nr:putative nucleotidyltransferase, ribonuclease H [Tanacetum cinerariifolium]
MVQGIIHQCLQWEDMHNGDHVLDVAAIENSPAVSEHKTVETLQTMSPENNAHYESKKEAIHLILTGIRDEIYSTVDACKTTQEMWEAIERKCRAPICWDQVGERIIEGPKMIEVTNAKAAVAKEKLKEARTRQKSYADKHRRSLEFQPGDHVFLKVSPARGVRRFGIKGNLSPRFIGPFEILDRVGEISYRLALPPQLSHVHDVFHVFLLRGYKYHPLHVITYPLDQIRTDLSYVEEPEAIIDQQDRIMRKKTIPFVKILWRNHLEREATWETEESIRTSYPHFLP